MESMTAEDRLLEGGRHDTWGDMVNHFLILALADDGLILDRTHAGCMRLPFERGWSAWQVYRRKGERDLSFVETFSTYAEARAFTEIQSLLAAGPPREGRHVH